MRSLFRRAAIRAVSFALLLAAIPGCVDGDSAPPEPSPTPEAASEVPVEIREHPGFPKAVELIRARRIPLGELGGILEIDGRGSLRLNERGLGLLAEGGGCGSVADASVNAGAFQGIEMPEPMGKKPGGGGGATCPSTPVSVTCPNPSTLGYTGFWGIYQVSVCRDDADSDGLLTTGVYCQWQQYAFPFYNYANTSGLSPELPAACPYCKNASGMTVPNTTSPPDIACVSGAAGVASGVPSITCGYATP